MTLTLAIPEEHAGSRLDAALAALLPQQSRAQIQRLIKDGKVQVSGIRPEKIKASLPVEARQEVVVDVPAPAPAAAQPQPLPLAIVYEDADIVVIDKAAGMVVHPAAGHASGTLVNALLHHVRDLSGVGGELRPGIVHRLDKDTS
ncbi:MAG TPA: S4 domain-containing protein, partial [Vicinamibacterales bacterium]|nr:S4 domain-containing protein [Vicinamibacterales bacterium]